VFLGSSSSGADIKGNVFKNNSTTGTAVRGGALFLSGPGLIENNTFVNNKASAGEGGAIRAGSILSPITIKNNIFRNNESTSGGAIYLSTANNSLIDFNTFDTNTGQIEGGAIYFLASNYDFSNNYFINCISAKGKCVATHLTAASNITGSNNFFNDLNGDLVNFANSTGVVLDANWWAEDISGSTFCSDTDKCTSISPVVINPAATPMALCTVDSSVACVGADFSP